MKPVKIKDLVHVTYDKSHWALLRKLRLKAIKVLTTLGDEGISDSYVIGSVARGDVRKDSDIDIVIPYHIPTFRVEETIMRAGFRIYHKEVTQPTPLHAVKAHIYIEEKLSITIPLTDLSKKELEFYKFAGMLGLKNLERGERAPGVNKRLLAVIPTSKGHIEFSIINKEIQVAKILNIELDIVRERIDMLTRRDEIGRTGIYFKLAVPPEESIEYFVRKNALRNPILRNRLKELI